MKAKERAKDGGKIILITNGLFGNLIYYGNRYADFRKIDLDRVKHSEAALFTSRNGKVVRVKCNGTNWYK